MKEYLYKTRGFTYIELLIVVGIMLIFGAFLVASVNPVERIKTQRDSQRESDLNSILLSVQQKIKNDRGWDCPSEPLPQDKFTAIGTGSGEYDLYSCLMPNYLSKYLVDPKEGSIAGNNITDGLVGHWKFDEGSGTTAYDASGNGNDGTLMSDPTWVDGKMGEALDFDGSSDYVNVAGSVSLDIADMMTLEVWVNPTAWNDGRIVCSTGGWGITKVDNDGPFTYDLYFADGTSTGWIPGGPALTKGQWSHVVLTYDKNSNGTAQIYVNGELEKTTEHGAKQLKTGGNIGMGAYYGGGSYKYNGLIDDVRIYNRALSAEEIQDLYNYEYSSKYAIWQNPVTKNISLKSLEDETKEVSTGAPELALDFDGSNDYVDCGNDESLNFGSGVDITISIWLRWRGSSNSEVMLSKGDGASGADGWTLRDGWGENSRILFRNNSIVLSAGSGWADNNWHFITVVIDRDGMSYLYIDGEIMDSIDSSGFGTFSNNEPFRMGRKPNGEYFNGTIDDVRIYNRALSAEEVEQLYKGYDIRNGIVGHWPLNEGTGTTAYDRSGNNNNGTLLPAGDGPTWTTK